jgi:hypothetical protein
MHVILVVSYLSIKLARCSVDPGINRGTRKLARTTRIIKKKKSTPPESKGQEMGFWEHFITCLPSNLASITHMISFFLFFFFLTLI